MGKLSVGKLLFKRKFKSFLHTFFCEKLNNIDLFFTEKSLHLAHIKNLDKKLWLFHKIEKLNKIKNHRM